jgi:ribosomal protein S18 acetylase RimI-like enzyme
MIAVPFPMEGPLGSGVDRFLEDQAWRLRQSPAIVMIAKPRLAAEAGADLRKGPESADGLSVAAEPDEDWLGMYHYRGQGLPPIARSLLMSAQWQAFASIREAGQTIAIGRIAAGDRAGLAAIETHADQRRRVLATRVTAALVTVAAARGVTGLYLQVETESAAARALHGGMGFTDHHRYHYRVAPPAAT